MPIELVDVALGDPPLGRSPEQVLQLVEALAAAPGGAGPLGDGIIAVMRSPSSREGSLERDAFRSGVAGVRLGDVPSMWLVEPDLLECLVMGACFHRDPAYVADIVGTQQSHSALLVALRLCALAGRTDVMRQLLCAKIRSYGEGIECRRCGLDG